MRLVRISTALACGTLLACGVPAHAADEAADASRTNGVTQAGTNVIVAAQSLVAGRAAMEDGLYDLAERELRAYLRAGVSADAPEAAVLLLQALYAQRRFADVLQALDAYGPLVAKSDALALPYWRAAALYEGGAIEKALAELAGIEKSGAESRYAGQAQRLAGWCLLKTGRVAEAMAAFGKYDDKRDAGADGNGERLEWAKAIDAAGQTDAASAILERLVAATNDARVAGESCYWLGQIRLRQMRTQDAVPLLTSVTANPAVRDDLRAGAWYGLAAAYQASTSPALAVAALTNGIVQAQDLATRRKGERALGLLLLDLKRYDEAIPMLRQSIASQPEAPEAGPTQLRLASSFLDRGAWDDAVREYQRYVETFTNRTGLAQAEEGQGWALAGLGRHAEATSAFLKAYGTETNPVARARCLMKAGDSCFANEQFKMALDAYTRVSTEFPESELAPLARFQCAESYLRAKEPAKAEESFLALARDLPLSPLAEESLMRAAEIRQADRRMDEAIALYDQIARVYTNSVKRDKTLLGRGCAQYQMYRFEQALADFQAVTSAYPTNRTAEDSAYWSSMCLYWMGRDDESIAAGRSFLERYPQSKWIPTLMFWLGKHEFNRQAYAAAEMLFMRFADTMPSDPKAVDALLWASRAASMRGEFLRANEIVIRLVKEHPGARQVAEARSVQGDALINLAKFPEAILVFEDLIARNPENDLLALAWLRKGDAQFMLGGENPTRYAEALQSYRVVAGNSQATLDLVLQAEYKSGRCYEKMGRLDDAIGQYYSRVIVRFLQEREKGFRHNEAAKLWFTRASFNAADIMEARKEWRQVVTILERVVDSGVAVAPETRERIKRLRSEHWWLFY